MQRYRKNDRYNSYKPRSLRRVEQKTKKNIIITIIVGIALLYSALTWGLPALIGGLSFLNKDDGEKAVSVAQKGTLAPPVLNIPYEATNSATIKISGYATPESSVKIYVDDQLIDTVSTNLSGQFEASSIPLTEGTNNIYGITTKDNAESLPSKNIKLTYSSRKPKLEISEPVDGHQIQGEDKNIRVSGLTDPENSVMVNGSTVILNGEGRFVTTVSLNEGENTISIVATNSVGNTTQMERKVTYTP